MKIRFTCLALGMLLLGGGCSSTSGGDDTVPTTAQPEPLAVQCGSILPRQLVGRLPVDEGSSVDGVAASNEDPGVLWAVGTDATGRPQLVASAQGGQQLADYGLDRWLEGVTDLSLGPGPDPDRDYLYVADLAPSRFDGDSVFVVRVPAPSPGERDGALAGEVFELALTPDAGRPLSVHVEPGSGDILVLSTSFDTVILSRATAPLLSDRPTRLHVEASLPPGAVRDLTDAAVGPPGGIVAAATFSGLSLWTRLPDETVAETLVRPACDARTRAIGDRAALVLRTDRTGLLSVDLNSYGVYEYQLPDDIEQNQGGPADVGNLAPQLVIARPLPSSGWQLGETIELEATVTNEEIDDSAFVWELLLHHCPSEDLCVADTIGVAEGARADMSPIGIGLPVPDRLELRVTATDDAGLSATASIDIDPRISTVSLASNPAGAVITAGAVTAEAPFSVEAIVGDVLPLGAEPTQFLEGSTYEFAGWSNTNRRFQDLTVEAADQTLTLELIPQRGFMQFTGTDGYADRSVSISSSTSTFDMRAWVALDDWTPERDQSVLGSNGNRLELVVTRNGNLQATVVTDSGATTRVTSTARPNPAAGERLWLRFVLDRSGREGRFYTSPDPENDALAAEWTQLGDPIALDLPGSIFGSIRFFVIGQGNLTQRQPLVGKLFGAAWLVDGSLLRRIDFSSTGQLSSNPPDYSRWGLYTLRGSGWEYVRSGAS